MNVPETSRALLPGSSDEGVAITPSEVVVKKKAPATAWVTGAPGASCPPLCLEGAHRAECPRDRGARLLPLMAARRASQRSPGNGGSEHPTTRSSQRALAQPADFAGVARASFYRCLGGTESMTLDRLAKIAAALEVEPHVLLVPSVDS